MDPITLAVIKGSLEHAADEMDEAFRLAAFSPVIAEGRDRASGFYDTNGEVVVQSSDGLPIFISVMQFTVQQVLSEIDVISPGDVYLVNDPYGGGTHLMDVKAVRPVFFDEELVGFVANTGHWPDIGGNVAGGYAVRAREIFGEGLQIPPVRVVHAGERNNDLIRFMMRNIRIPERRMGDFEAQINCLELGERRIQEIYARFGRATMDAFKAELFLRSEQQMRSCIASIPDGTYRGTDFLDSDGIRNEPLRIELGITVTGDEITFDFEGSSPPCLGPMNSVRPSTISACWIALKHLYPEVPINAGSFEPCNYNIPPTTFMASESPRPVSGCAAEVSQRIIDVVFRCLSQAIPDKVPAAAFSTVNNLALGGTTADGRPYVTYIYGGGGYGGSTDGDGLTNGPSTVSNAPHPAIEIFEQTTPIRFLRFELREDSAGAGRSRGGFGVVREFELLEGDALVSFLGDRGKFAPFGLQGGGEAAMTEVVLRIGGEEYRPEHVTKDENVEMRPGDSVCVSTPGGGGWGDPRERPTALVARDIALGYISLEKAQELYGYEPEGAA